MNKKERQRIINSIRNKYFHVVLPDGKIVGEWMRPQITSAYRNGKMPALLEH